MDIIDILKFSRVYRRLTYIETSHGCIFILHMSYFSRLYHRLRDTETSLIHIFLNLNLKLVNLSSSVSSYFKYAYHPQVFVRINF